MKKLTLFSNNEKYYFNLDLIIPIFGCLIAPVLTLFIILSLKTLFYIVPVFLSFFSCLIYLRIRKNISSLNLKVQVNSRHYQSIYFNIIFLFLFLCSILVFYLRTETYTRPMEYFFLLAIINAFICLEILYVPYNKICSSNILFKILLLSLSASVSELLIYPTLVGEDPFEHQFFTTQIINSGYIPNDYIYSKLPIFHLIIEMTSIIANLDYKSSVILSISLTVTICTMLFIFLIGTKLFNPKIGLLSVALLSISNRYIRMIYEAIPNTVAVVYVLIILYLLFNMKPHKSVKNSILLLFIMFILILTHAIVSVWMSILLFIIYISYRLCIFSSNKNVISDKNSKIFYSTMILVFNCLTFFWWVYISHHIDILAVLFKDGFSNTKLLINIPTTLPIIEQVITNLPMFIFYSVSFIGCFYMLSQYSTDKYKFSLSICSLVTVAICFSGPILERFIIVGRWEYFSYLLLAIPLAVSIYLLLSVLKNKSYLPHLYFSFVFLLTFLMIISPTSNIDNYTFSPHCNTRYGFMESEVQSIETFSKIWEGNIYIDGYYMCLRPENFTSVKSLDSMLYCKDFGPCGKSPIFIRTELIGTTIDMFRNFVVLDYNPTELLEKQKFSRIYDCETVSIYRVC